MIEDTGALVVIGLIVVAFLYSVYRVTPTWWDAGPSCCVGSSWRGVY